MISSINYFKFDLRLIKESIKIYAFVPAIFCAFIMFSGDSYILGTSYLFFFLIIFATAPFSAQINEKSNQIYYMFPSKITDMVRGRFLYLVCISLIVFLINGILVVYLYMQNKFQGVEILLMFLSGVLSLVTCLIQYPIFYKFDLEKGRAISMIIYLFPAFIIFAFPSFILDNNYLFLENLKKFFIIALNNSIQIILLSGLILSCVGYISYCISCRICKKKEI